MNASEALAIVGRVATIQEPPIWLCCGVGVAFLAGRWTRDHHDVDFMTFAENRTTALAEFERAGLGLEADHGWVTHWDCDGKFVELVFVDRTGPDSGDVVVCPCHTLGGMISVGRHPGLAHDLDLTRFATLDGVRIRVGSPAGEWALRRGYRSFRPAAEPVPKVANDLALLEALLTPEDRARAEVGAGRVLPLRPGDCSSPAESERGDETRSA